MAKRNEDYTRGELVERVVQSGGAVHIIFPSRDKWQGRNRPGATNSPPKFALSGDAQARSLASGTGAGVKHFGFTEQKSEKALPIKPKGSRRNRWFGDGESVFR